jgi:hypothetical protein
LFPHTLAIPVSWASFLGVDLVVAEESLQMNLRVAAAAVDNLLGDTDMT